MFIRDHGRRAPKSAGSPTLNAGAADHLEMPFRQWIWDILGNDEANAQRVALHLRLRVDTSRVYSPARHLAFATRGEQLVDVIDSMLRLSAPSDGRRFPPGVTRRTYVGTVDWREANIAALQEMLTLAGSAYRVNEAHNGLRRRTEDTVQLAAAAALSAAHTAKAGSAAEHLAEAWRSAYGRDPDPSRAYSEAVKAVESAAMALIEPNNCKATLGTMLWVIRNAPQRFTTAISASTGNDIDLIEDMMRRLWHGQTSGHSSQNPTQLESQPHAEMAVHLAATLVHWFAAGLIRNTA